jgi:hypothetical protein
MTFEIPRHIEGHDMLQCNVVQIHYINIDAQTRQQSKDVYEVTDMQVSPEDSNVVICSWLISHNATKYAGSLNFLVRFSCVGDQANLEYAWNTAIYSGISVSNGINNGEAVVEEYADILEQWYEELLETLENKTGVQFTTDKTLTLANGVLSVNMATTTDRTLPIRASDVDVTVGNINVLLGII